MLGNCPLVTDLKIEELDFGSEASELTDGVKIVFKNLVSLDLSLVYGDIRMLMDTCPMPNLLSFSPYG